MASTYVNDLRLNEMATGDESGNWGVVTNLNLELIGEALSFGTEAITTNADTHTTTVADGAADPGRAMYLKYTGTLDSACTITIAPNTMSRMQFIENGTSGSQNIIISQGSGANVTIPAGDTKAVYLDGAGSGAAVVDAFASLSVVDLKVQDDLTVTDDLIVNGDIDLEGSIDVNGTANLDVVDIDGAVDMATTLAVAGNVDFNGGLDVDGTTNLDVVDIDGTVDMSGSLTMSGSALIRTTDGTASIPGLRIGVDNDTGFYRPLANTIGFVTTGAERMRLDASGNVGIGNSSPSSYESTARQLVVGSGSGSNGITIASASDGLSRLFFADGTSGGQKYDSFIAANHTDSALIFGAGATGGEAMRLDSSGNVLIGTTTSLGVLTVKAPSSDDNDIITITEDGTNQAFSINSNFAGAGSTGNNITLDSYWTNDIISFRGDGKVGIGTTSPVSELHVDSEQSDTTLTIESDLSSSLFTSGIDLIREGVAKGSRIESLRDASAGGVGLNFLTTANNTAEVNGTLTSRMVVLETGEVGIGLTSPNEKLVVSGNASVTGALQITSDTSAPSAGAAIFRPASNTLAFVSNSAERMRMDSSGRLLIGTTSALSGASDARLQVQHNVANHYSAGFFSVRSTASENYGIRVRYPSATPNGTSNQFIECSDATAKRFAIRSNGGIENYQSNDVNLSDERVKKNIVDTPDTLEIIKNLKVRDFQYKDQTDDKTHTGLIAQETEKVDASLVDQNGWSDEAPEGEEPYKAIYNTDLMFKMLKAIQEQQEQIEQLKTEIQTLKGE